MKVRGGIIVLGVLALVRCSAFEPATSSDSNDGGTDGSAMVDAAAPPGSDAATADAGPDDSDCSSQIPIVGSADITQKKVDSIPSTGIDAYGYPAVRAARVRCAHIYVAEIDSGIAVTIGLYSSAPASGPDQLLATAVIETPTSGWNAAVLSSTVEIQANNAYWLGAKPSSGNFQLVATQNGDCPTNSEMRAWNGDNLGAEYAKSMPPEYISKDPTVGQCHAAMYVSE